MDEQRKPETDNQKNVRRPGNPNASFTFRLLGAGVVLYWLYQLIMDFVEGGPEAPSVGVLIAAILIMGGGSIFVAVMAFKIRRDQEKANEAGKKDDTPALPTEDPEDPQS